jgi:hypothetical protein
MSEFKDYQRIALDVGVLATELNSWDCDKEYVGLCKLAVYHLRAAKTDLLKIAEWLAHQPEGK